MKKSTGYTIQYIGVILIVTVMFLDNFVFALSENYVLTCAIISAILIILGMQIVKRKEKLESQNNHQKN